LQEEKEAAQSKMMKLEKCTEIEAVEERDDLQAIVIKLQNTIEDLTIQVGKTKQNKQKKQKITNKQTLHAIRGKRK